MTGVMLDTSAYSAFVRDHAEIVTAIREAEEIVVNPIVLGELASGFLGGRRNAENREKLNRFLTADRVRVVSVDSQTADFYSVIKNYLKSTGKALGANDVWIAATAMQYGLKLLTTDTGFQSVPQVFAECFDV